MSNLHYHLQAQRADRGFYINEYRFNTALAGMLPLTKRTTLKCPWLICDVKAHRGVAQGTSASASAAGVSCEHSGSTTSSGPSSVNSRSTSGVMRRASATALASCT